jgi:transposase-like protein
MPRGKKPYFTPDQDQEIARRYQADETLRSIAGSYGVTPVPVIAALKRQGVERRGRGEPWQDTLESRTEIIRLWHQGISVKHIAGKIRARDANVSRVLRDAGISPRLGGKHHRFDEEQTAVLVSKFQTGVSLAELAREYESNPITVRGALRRAGVDTRSNRHRSGPDHHNWKGGRVPTDDGYIKVRPTAEEALLCPPNVDGYVLEHRLVMAKALGRPLLGTETVHHIRSSEKDNNDLSNLQLRQGHHGSGAAFQCRSCGSHDVVAVPLAPEGVAAPTT